MNLTAVIHTEKLSDESLIYVSHCPELDVASQGETREEALANLREAVQGILEVADKLELERRLKNGATVEALEVAV